MHSQHVSVYVSADGKSHLHRLTMFHMYLLDDLNQMHSHHL
jgi:hypothetical protein